jgi:hypothetical protein
MKLAKSGNIDPLVEGKHMRGIFGFCDIRQFTDATECLQERVMVFVNQIGEIVHTAVHMYNGAANKNIGDAFLLVWTVMEDRQTAALADRLGITELEQLNLKKLTPEQAALLPEVIEEQFQVQADNALMSFLKSMVDIENSNRYGKLLPYVQDAKIRERFPGGFRVCLGFGLHYGWAIEGVCLLVCCRARVCGFLCGRVYCSMIAFACVRVLESTRRCSYVNCQHFVRSFGCCFVRRRCHWLEVQD